MERAYKVLHSSSIDLKSATEVPEKDKADFIRAYESGNRDEAAAKVLDREGFRKSMFKGADAKVGEHVTAEKGRSADGDLIEKRTAGNVMDHEVPSRAQKSGTKADLDISNVNLDGLQLAEANAQASSADIPSAKGATARGGPSVRGG